jgi:hypothetical protein
MYSRTNTARPIVSTDVHTEAVINANTLRQNTLRILYEEICLRTQFHSHTSTRWTLCDLPHGAMNENTKLESNDFRSTLPRFTPEALKANQALVKLFASIAERKEGTPAQIALAWLLAQKPDHSNSGCTKLKASGREHWR